MVNEIKQASKDLEQMSLEIQEMITDFESKYNLVRISRIKIGLDESKKNLEVRVLPYIIF